MLRENKPQTEEEMDQEDLAEQCDKYKPPLWFTCLFWMTLLAFALTLNLYLVWSMGSWNW